MAEWNFHTDPEAAEHVLTACAAAEGLTVRICGQNLTDQAQITPAQVTAMREEDRREITQELARALDFYIDFHERVGEGSHAKVHDLAALTLGLEPERAHWTPAQVHVACEDPFTRGMSVAEMRPERFERGRTSVLIATGMARGAAPDMLSDWVARHLAWRTEQSPRTWS